MQFDFATATRILFGFGTLRQVPAAAAEFGAKPLVVTGGSARRAATLMEQLPAAVPFRIPAEPTIDIVRQGTAAARQAGCDMVIAIGGGSAIDGAKAIAALLANPGDPLEYLEVVGNGKPLTTPSVPFIAIPTTAGTGSEVTRNAVLASPEHRVKASLRSPFLLPRLAVIDPDLTLDLPHALTASTGLDALTQLIEPYVCSKHNRMSDMFCSEGLRCVSRSLRYAFHYSDRDARSDMAMAGLMGGLALANAGLGVVHGFAAPIGGMFSAPHGAVCAAILPHGMRANIAALQKREPEGRALFRYGLIAEMLTIRQNSPAEDGVAWVEELCRELEIPPLRTYGVSEADIPVLVEKAARASSMKANPVELTTEELTSVLRAAL